MSIRQAARHTMLFLLLLLPATGTADGKFFAEPKESEPWIPRQTMLAVFRDGMEILIVESELSAESGKRFAWVVPLPAEPTEIRKGNPGQLQTVLTCLSPEISDAANEFPLLVLIPLLFVSIWFSVGIRKKKGPTLLELLLVFAVIAILAAIAVPNFLGVDDVPQLPELASSQTVGNYQVDVLRPKATEEISNWFDKEGFAPLAVESAAAFNEYIKEDWVFAVAQLRRDSNAGLKPHPLQFVFPAKSPVFPMRLTADPGHITNLSLVLIGEKPYDLPGFETVYRDRFQQNPQDYKGWSSDDPQKLPLLVSAQFARRIGDQQIVELAGKESWITYFRAKMDANAMAADLYPVVAPEAKPVLLHLYTRDYASGKAWTVGMLMVIVTLPIASWLAKRRKHLSIAILCILCVGVGSGFANYHSYRLTEVIYKPGNRRYDDGIRMHRDEMLYYAKHNNWRDPKVLEESARKAVKHSHLTEGVGPSTYRIEREGDAVIISATDRIGRAYRMNLTQQAAEFNTTETLHAR